MAQIFLLKACVHFYKQQMIINGSDPAGHALSSNISPEPYFLGPWSTSL